MSDEPLDGEVVEAKPKRKNKKGAGRPFGSTVKLTEMLIGAICQDIRMGVYDYIAAEAQGVYQPHFLYWLERGETQYEEGKTNSLYAKLFINVLKAKADARQDAERRVYAADPRFWLARGSARDRTAKNGNERLGWSENRQLQVTGANGEPLKLTVEFIDKLLTEIEGAATAIDDDTVVDAEEVRLLP